MVKYISNECGYYLTVDSLIFFLVINVLIVLASFHIVNASFSIVNDLF